MVSQSSETRITLAAIARSAGEAGIVYDFEINGAHHFFDARVIDRNGIRAVEMSEPLESLLQQMLPVLPHIAKTLVDVTLKIIDGDDKVLPIRIG